MNRVILQQLLISFVLSVSINIYAIDFGVQGQTFKVAEESFIAMLKKRLDAVDIEAEQQKIQAKAKDSIENPIAVSGINPAIKDRIFYFDPSYILDKDVVLPCGKILYKAGHKVNPLEHMDFDRRLIFIDGRDKKQISWLREQKPNALLQDRVILIAGKIFNLQENLGKQIYFDQAGEITSKFGIKHVPAIVVAEGNRLKIVEIKI